MDTTMNRNELFRGDQTSVGWLSGLDTIAGIWLFVSAYVFNNVSRELFWSNFICGIIVTVLAATRAFSAAGRRQPWMSWLNGILGVWTIITPWALRFSGDRSALWSNLITGLVIAVLAFASASASQRTTPVSRTAVV
jgi:hypothetical protein